MDELKIGKRVEIVLGEHEGRRGEIVGIRSHPMSSGRAIKRYIILLDLSGPTTKPKTVGLGGSVLKVEDETSMKGEGGIDPWEES